MRIFKFYHKHNKMKFELFPIDILNKILEYLDLISSLVYFRLSKRFLSLDRDNFWKKKIEIKCGKWFTRSFYNIQKYNYVAYKYHKLCNKNIRHLRCDLMEKDSKKRELNDRIKNKLRNILIDYLKKKYPDNFKIIYGEISKELYAKEYQLGRDAVKEDKLFAAASNALDAHGKLYNLVLTKYPIYCGDYGVYDSVGFINDDIRFKIIGNINNRIKFPSSFCKFMDALGLEIEDAWKLYDIPDYIKYDFVERFSLPHPQRVTIGQILPEEEIFAEDKIICGGHLPMYNGKINNTNYTETLNNEKRINWEEVRNRNRSKMIIQDNRQISEDMPPLES